jgi:signal peptidase I
MASDPYGRDGYDDRADDQHPRNRPLDQAGDDRGQQQPFGGVSYPGHDYWATTGRPDAEEAPRAYDGGWSGSDRDAYGRRDVPLSRDIAPPNREIPPPGREIVPGGRDVVPGGDAWGRGGQGREQTGQDAWGREPDRGDWNRGSRAWDDPYGSRRGQWDRDEPPMVRDRAFENDNGYDEPGDRRERERADRYERSYDRGERSIGSGSGARRGASYDEDDSVSTWRSKVRRKRKNMPLWQELPLLLIVAFCLAVLIRTFLVQAFFIPSGSMEETLLVGDRVLVNKVLYDVREPERGEVVVFTGPDTWAPENQVDQNAGFFAELGRTVGDLVGFSQPGEKDFIKRVIGLPGDTVACCDVDGRVTVNGYPLDESAYLYDNSPLDAAPNPKQCTARRFGPIKVQAGQMFVMGDHRGVSQDSRCQGQVPIDNVIGRAFVILWPSSRWSWLPVPDTFKNVPKPAALAPPGPHVTRAPHAPLVPDMVLVPIAVSVSLSTRSARQDRLRRR